ncbi:MAG: ABC transporter permease [Chloroflexi bacterium]|nr:ABC transporter permease [Chloroflexota bacterium]
MQTQNTQTQIGQHLGADDLLRAARGLTLRRALSWLEGNEVFVVFLVLLAIAPELTDKFLTPLNIKNLLSQSAIVGILAIAQFLVIVIGGFDMSVAGILALSAVIIAYYTPEHGVELAVVYGLGAGLGMGLINGLAVTRGRVPPLIATLATLGAARGLAFMITEKSISVQNAVLQDINAYSVEIPTNPAITLTGPALIWLGLVLIIFLFLSTTRLGIHIYATGGGEDTARLAGVKINTVKLGVYMFAGFLSAVGGLVFVIRSRSGVPHVGTGWELTTIASVIIGGTMLTGGEGNLIKAMFGVLIYQMIGNILNLMRLDPFYHDIVRAVVILIAVSFSMWRSARRTRTG